jgi:hypothetical protein
LSRYRAPPVGHQGLDHLPVGRVGDVAHRAGPVDDPGYIKAPAEPGDDRQCPQRLSALGGP